MDKTAVIVGAGPAGLTAALELLRRTGYRPVVFESDSQVGGISRTINYRGNRMDLGGHRFFSKSDWVMDFWQEMLPVASDGAPPGEFDLGYQGQRRSFVPSPAAGAGEMLVRNRVSRILYRRKFFDYPLRLSARTLGNLGLAETGLVGLHYAAARLRPRHPERSLEDFLINRFGDRLYRTFFKSYTEKVWGVDCREISAEWGAQRIKGLSITKALSHALKSTLPHGKGLAQKGVETSLIERFLYPKLGPGQMWEEVAARVVTGGGEIRLRHAVVGIQRAESRVNSVDVRDLDTGETRRIRCDALLSTMPLAELVRQLSPERADLAATASALPYRDFMTAGLLVRRLRPAALKGCPAGAKLPPDNWIYVQEPDVKLGRLQVFNNWSPHLVKDPDTVWLGLEYFCNEGDGLWGQSDGAFLDFAARELEQIDFADRRDVLDGTVVRVPKAYPAYFGAYAGIGAVRSWLDAFTNLYPIGRNGMHRYNNQDHSMLAARAAVDCLAGADSDKRELWKVNAEEEYHEERREQNSTDEREGGQCGSTGVRHGPSQAAVG